MVHYLCAIFCFGMSSIYHLFNSHSKKMMNFWIRFDYAGICLMIAGSSTPPLYYSFACNELEQWRFFYLGMVYAFCFFTLCVMMIPYFDQDHFQSFRGMLFGMTGLVNVIPVLHICCYVEPQYLHHFQIFPWLFGGILYIIGAVLYGLQFPECCCPNKFDFFGSSHQIFHILIVSAALLHYYGSIEVFHDR